jgi:hypothetical protein
MGTIKPARSQALKPSRTSQHLEPNLASPPSPIISSARFLATASGYVQETNFLMLMMYGESVTPPERRGITETEPQRQHGAGPSPTSSGDCVILESAKVQTRWTILPRPVLLTKLAKLALKLAHRQSYLALPPTPNRARQTGP